MGPIVEGGKVWIVGYGLVYYSLLELGGCGKCSDEYKSNQYANHAERLEKQPCEDNVDILFSVGGNMMKNMIMNI